MDILTHSYFLIAAIVLAFWVPTLALPFQYGFVSENEGYIETDLNQYNTITFITYPIDLIKMSDVRKYNITFTSMLSLSNFTRLIIFEQSSKSDLHEELSKILINKFGEKRVSFITNEEQEFYNNSNLLILTDFSARAFSLIRTKFGCYINANVAVDPFWYDRIKALSSSYYESNPNSPIYFTGRRIQVPLSTKEIKNFINLPSKNFYKSLRKLIRSKEASAKCIKQCESDYFVFTVDPFPFDLRYLPEFKLTGGFFSMYLNYYAESRKNSFCTNEKVPVYYLDSLPDINDPKYKEDSQYNYDIILNNSLKITKNHELSNRYNGKVYLNKWFDTEVSDSSFSPFLSNINCTDEKDMANIKLTSFFKVDNHQYQDDNFNRNPFPFDNDQNQIDENDEDLKNKNDDDLKKKKDEDFNENNNKVDVIDEFSANKKNKRFIF